MTRAYNTKWITLTLGERNTIITGYLDSNLAACKVSRLTLSAYVVYVGCGPVEWGTKKQALPTDATAIAELVAANKTNGNNSMVTMVTIRDKDKTCDSKAKLIDLF